MTEHIQTDLASLISAFYDEFLALYGDEDIAAVATAATINDLLERQVPARRHEEAA